MNESEKRKEFAENLLAYDPPPPDKELQHKEILFKKFKRHIWRGKVIGGTIYLVVFSIAFWASMRGRHSNNIVHSVCWSAVSLHILLWFLIYFLRETYRMMAKAMEKSFPTDQKPSWRKDDLFVTVMAVVVFVYTTIFLYRSFTLTDPLRAVHAVSYLGGWSTVFFIFWYPFGIASLLAKLWLSYKEMELGIAKPQEQNDK